MNKIINILKEKKSIPLDKFISVSLYDKKYGYYMRKNPFGEKGDFITAPMISSLFGNSGKHTRAAVSTNSLPLGAAVEIDAIFEIK